MNGILKYWRANCKTPAFCNFEGPFPLTPALSLSERENQGPRCNNSNRLAFSNAIPAMLPLPEGEGRGEGEQIVQIPDRCDLCNRPWNIGTLKAARTLTFPALHHSCTPPLFFFSC